MRYVDRSAVEVPAYFSSDGAIAARVHLMEFVAGSAARKSQSRVPVVGKALTQPGVREALASLFDGKCAFCESKVETQPYRFRSAKALPRRGNGLHYFWLADVWENLYSICEECRGSEADLFPVEGSRASRPRLTEKAAKVPTSEKALLLDPCRKLEFEAHLQFRSNGRADFETTEGDATIKRFRLNRRSLVARRRAVFSARLAGLRELLRAQGDWEDVAAKTDEHLGYPFPGNSAPFAGAWRILLKRIGIDISKRVNPKNSPSQDVGSKKYFERLAVRKGVPEILDQVLERLGGKDTPDEGVPTIVGPARAPLLGRIHIQDFKGLHQLEIKMPQPRPAPDPSSPAPAPGLLILGENSAGKSSILEAIALALAQPADREDAVEDISDLILDPTYLGGNANQKPSTASIQLSFAGGAKRTIQIDGTKFAQSGGRRLAPVFAYGAYRHYLKGATPIGRWTPIGTLFHTERMLSNPEEWLLGLKVSDFKESMKALRFVMSIEGDFDAVERKGEKCMLVQRIGGAKGAVMRSPLGTASSGYRAVLAMVCDLIKGLMDVPGYQGLEQAEAIVLIDEIEAHLHPRWKMHIMRGLRQAFPQVTFIATTHDPLCLRGMEDGEVRVLHRIMSAPNGIEAPGTTAVEILADLPKLSELTIEQLLTSDHFGLYTTDRPELEERYADALDLLRREKDGEKLGDEEMQLLNHFRRDVGHSLPVGSSEVHRMIQWAVAAYLEDRRKASAKRLQGLKDDAKKIIADALAGI